MEALVQRLIDGIYLLKAAVACATSYKLMLWVVSLLLRALIACTHEERNKLCCIRNPSIRLRIKSAIDLNERKPSRHLVP